MSFASRLKEQRLKMGLTQATLAEALGVTKSAIGNYETGLNSPKAETLFKVFEVLQCDANYLFQDEMADIQMCIRDRSNTCVPLPTASPRYS